MSEQANPEQSDSVRAAALPLMIGLCPTHAGEFYFPIDPTGERHVCPECPRELVTYVRSRLPEGYRS